MATKWMRVVTVCLEVRFLVGFFEAPFLPYLQAESGMEMIELIELMGLMAFAGVCFLASGVAGPPWKPQLECPDLGG